MNELELIVQRMIDAGEPEQNIAAVIKEYESLELGKTIPLQKEDQGATVEAIQAPDMDSNLDGISLDLQPTRKEKEAAQEIGVGAVSSLTGVPEFMVPGVAAASSFVLNMGSGLIDFAEKYGYAPMKAIIKAGGSPTIMPELVAAEYENIAKKNNIDVSEIYEAAEVLDQFKVKKYDDQGNELDVIGLINDGRYADAAELAVNEAIGSAPSMALSIAFPAAGSILLGMGTAGQEFEQALKERPDETISKIAGASLAKGAFETATEYLGGKLTRTLGGLNKINAPEQVIKDFTSNFTQKSLKSLLSGIKGIAGEGFTEAITTFGQMGTDALIFGDEIDREAYFRSAANSFIIGGILGGPVAGTSKAITLSSIDKKNAYKYIAPKNWKNRNNEIDSYIYEAQQNLKNATPNKKQQFEQQIEVLKLQKENHLNNLEKAFDNLSKAELNKYAENIGIIDNAFSEIDNNRYTKNQQIEAKKRSDAAMQENENLVGKENYDFEVEKSIGDALKKTENDLKIALSEAAAINIQNKDLEIIKLNPDEAAKMGLQDKDAAFLSKEKAKKRRIGDKAVIFINTELAKETGQTNVIGHELLHYMMSKYFKTDNDSLKEIVGSFKDYVAKVDKENNTNILERIEQRITDNYKDSEGNIRAGGLEEYLNIFSDLISKEKIELNESFSDRIKNSVTTYLNGMGFGSVKLNSGKDVFNFIRGYNKNISQFKFKQLDINIKSDKISKSIQEEIEKFSKSEKASDKVQKIYEKQGLAGALDIINEFTPIVNKLVNKYRDVPGFEFQLLKDEIETGERGILDMIQAYTPEKAKGAPLAGYINKFLAKRAIEAANRVLGTEFTLDVTEAKGVADTVTAEEIIEIEEAAIADEIKSLRKEIGLPKDLITTVKTAVIKTFGTKLPNPEDPKFRFELQKRFRTELKKPISKFVGTRADYENFLRNNFKAIYDKMPQSLINRRFDEFAEPVLDENGKQLRERTAEGNKIFTKKKITPAEWIKYFLGTDVGSSTKGARKTAIVEGIAEEIAFDATMEVLRDPDIIQKYQEIAEITEVTLPENFKALIAKQIDRSEDFKFSSSIAEIGKTKYNLSKQELARELFNNTLLEIAKGRPDIYSALTNESFRQSFPRTFNEIIVPAFNKIIKESDPTIAEQITIHFIKTYSRPVRTFSKKETPLSSTTNKLFYDNYIEPALRDTGLLNKNKFNLVEKNNKTYLNYGNNPIVNLIDVTNKATIKDIISGKISKTEVLKQNNAARAELDYIIFNLGSKNKGLALSIIKLAQKDQRTIFRNAAPLYSIVQNYTGDTVYEHNPPVQYVFEQIADYLQNQTPAKKEALKKLLNTMEANIVPKDFANIVDSKYKNTIPTDGSLRYQEAIDKTNYQFDNRDFKFSSSKASLNKEFNKILEASTGVKWTENYSPSTAKMLARGKGKGNIFIPYSAEDFVGLLYTTLSGKEVGEQQMKWYEENLIRPFSRGIQAYEAEKQRAMREWSVLKQRATKDVPGGLKKKNESGFTNEESLRMYIWQNQGMEIPNIKKGEVNKAIKAVRNNQKFKEFANTLMSLNPEGYPEPSNNWIEGDITSDLIGYVNGAKRAEFLTEWKENVDEIFSEKNKTKLRALYGDRYVEALEDILFRMERGTNRSKGTNKQTRAWMDWVNNSVGTIMFFNARSAVLQTLSTVNFINFTDNNPINAALALANFGQYRKDFVDLFNSDFLKQRRSGLQIDVNADEIAKATKGNEKSPRAILKALLQFGFTPTQIADSFAIAAGGATFYRNRINKYIKEGLSKTEAQKRAFTDFQEIAEETQQSARPDRISMEQASSLGRVILAFANTPMQYARLQKKAFLDLINKRGDWKTNTSKIMYYGVIQNIIFSALQQALFALLFDDEDEAEEKSRYYKIANSSFDTLLRGVGVAGAGAATVKNIILEIIDQAKSKRPDYTQAAIAATSISPPINSKLRKLLSAGRAFTYRQSREKIFTEGFSLENPALLAAGQVLSAGLNIPADRVVIKADHLYTAIQPETELWQSIALSLGWSEWDLGMIEKQTKKESTKKVKKRGVKR